ncbi:MAG: cytochrome d ubiquinol oxidase subunit II [Pseudomonadota bacterium]
MTALQVTWFFLVGILLTGYAVLDGFDLGVGFWHLFTKRDEDRRILLGAIGPVWDGNEVWLLTGGGAIFAAFPPVYASVFSGFYLALMLVLFALIFRAVSIEVRSKEESPAWRRSWDIAFSAGSVIAALLFGVAMGNLLRGIPLDANGNYTGTFFGLLSPYALLIGITGLAMIATHGAVFIMMKTGDELQARAGRWAQASWVAFLVLVLVSAPATYFTAPQRFAGFSSHPVLWLVPAVALGAIVVTGVFIRKRDGVRAFAASALSIAGLMGIFAASVFPALVPGSDGSAVSLTITNASSSQRTLTIMLVMALIGMPIVIGYTIWIYRTFRGKVKVEDLHY